MFGDGRLLIVKESHFVAAVIIKISRELELPKTAEFVRPRGLETIIRLKPGTPYTVVLPGTTHQVRLYVYMNIRITIA